MSLRDQNRQLKEKTAFSMFFRKQLSMVLCIVLACLMGGLYGILHDQLTYTISPEYYTKFKFYQFGLMDLGNEAIFPNPRIQVSLVGFMATWWMGLPVGLILGMIGLIHQDPKRMFRFTFRALLINLLVAFITGLTGLVYGKFFITISGLNWYFPDNLIDLENFVAVGSMHNFSYLGGIIGLIAGCVYTIKKKQKT